MTSKSRIAVLGLGIMGHGIADNYLKNGYDVTVWNRSIEKCADLKAMGASVAESIKDAVQNADLVFEVTASDDSSRALWFGDGGILENANASQSLITCATLSVDYTSELIQACNKKGLTFFDMPMTGGRVGAETGNLILLVGGDKTKLETIQNDLEAITSSVKYFGPSGSGMKFKLILNYVQAVHISLFGDALRIAKAQGLDTTQVGEFLAERPGGMHSNIALDAYKKEPEQISFSVDWITKDLKYANAMAVDSQHLYLESAYKIFNGAVEDGLGQEDWTAVNKNN